MLPIVVNDQHLSKGEFIDFLRRTCEEHRNQGRALAFAFLVFDFENATIRQILASENHWAALDEISGKYLTIFYLHATNRRFRQLLHQPIPEPNEGTIGYFTAMALTQLSQEDSLKFLRDTFGITEYVKTPFIVFFQLVGDELLSFSVQLSDEYLEESFLELREYIKSARESMERILPENYDASERIFYQLENAVQNTKRMRLLKTVVSKVTLTNVTKLGSIITTGSAG